MIRWRFPDPFQFRDLMDQMLQQSPRQWRSELMRGEPMPLNVHETETETVVEAALPGVKPEDVEITGNEGVLTIRASSQVEEKDYHHQEIYSVEYQRQLSVPQNVRLDQAKAEFENGILRVHLPKQQPKVPERVRIEVSGGGSRTPIEASKGDGYTEVKSSGANPKSTRSSSARQSSSRTRRSTKSGS
jgi:HSP20 family protein